MESWASEAPGTENLTTIAYHTFKSHCRRRSCLHNLFVHIPTALLNDSRSPPPNYSNLNTPDISTSPPSTYTTPNPSTADSSRSPPPPKKPPDTSFKHTTDLESPKRRLSVTFSNEVTYRAYTFFPPPLATTPPITSDISKDVLKPTVPEDLGLAITTTAAPPHIPDKPALAPPAPPTRSKSEEEIMWAITRSSSKRVRALDAATHRPEAVMLGFLWMLYFGWLATNQTGTF